MANSAHPKICLFHWLFKMAAVLSYVFFGIVSSDKLFTYILVICFCACDFWTVKNVSGR